MYYGEIPFLHSENSILWDGLDTFLSNRSREVSKVESRGFCALLSIQQCLAVDLKASYSMKNISKKLLRELKDHVADYLAFSDNSTPESLLKEAKRYLSLQDHTSYVLPVVDIMLAAAANAASQIK